MSKYTPFIKEAIKSLPREAKIARRIYRDMRDAGRPITSVYDGEETCTVSSRTEMMELVFNLDDCYLSTQDGSWIHLVLGEGWDTIVDYTTNLEYVMRGISEWTEEQELKEER